jgi:hypothetical protein
MTCQPPHTISNTRKAFPTADLGDQAGGCALCKDPHGELPGEGRGGEHSGDAAAARLPWAAEVALGYLRPAEL